MVYDKASVLTDGVADVAQPLEKAAQAGNNRSPAIITVVGLLSSWPCRSGHEAHRYRASGYGSSVYIR